MILQKYLNKKITWIIFFLLIISVPWFADLGLLIYGSRAKTFATFIDPSFEEVWISGLLLTLFIFGAFTTALVFCRPVSSYTRCTPIATNNNIDAACLSLLPVFILLNLIFLENSLHNGIFDAILAFRFNTQKIGLLGYLIILFCPIVLAVTWTRNKSLFNYSFLLLISFTNLLTGFRILLIHGLILIYLYNYRHFSLIGIKKKVLFILFLFFSLIIYENFRSALEAGDILLDDDGRSILDSIARSVPISYISMALRESVVLDWSLLFGILIEPFSIVASQIFPSLGRDSASTSVSEPLVRSFLISRGAPTAEATGFSIHVLAQAFLFDGVVGVLLFSGIIGLFLGLGVSFILDQNNSRRLLGTLFLTFVLSCSEVFSEAWKLLWYWMGFYIIIILYARILSILKPRPTR